MTQSDEPIPIDHASVVKRLEEVTSSEYPFPIPERPKPDKSLRINLTSFQNLRPVLRSTLVFVVNTCCPLWAVACLVWGCYSCCFCYCTDTNSNNNSSSSNSKLAFSLAAVLLAKSASESFLLHYVTNGRYGGLGCGGTCRTTGLPNTTAREGFFANPRNPRNARLKERLGRFVVEYAPTPYLYSGDLLTMAPFLLFKGSEGGRVPYRRYWVKVPVAPAPDGDDGPSKRPSCESDDDHNDNDNEAVALDVVFPKDGYRSDKPTFVILHGLNGGSTEPYVLDLARRATAEGHTVAVVINRGLMKTPVRGDVTFHGARTSDVGCAVDALHYALYGRSRFAKQTQAQKQTQTQNDGCPNNNSSSSSSGNNNNSNSSNKSNLVMVGFSMGGIIVANYAAKSGEHSGLAGALSFSGTLCTAKNLLDCPAARHSAGVWQPALAWGLKASIVKPSMHKFAKKGVTVREVEEVQSVTEIDTKLVCKYHGYKTVYDYYEDMSAGGLGDAKGLKRLDSTRIPLLAVHAIDDPITIYEVTLADEVDKTENVMLLATKHGGHIGWPTGWFPSKNRWSFMMDIAMEFASEVAVVR